MFPPAASEVSPQCFPAPASPPESTWSAITQPQSSRNQRQQAPESSTTHCVCMDVHVVCGKERVPERETNILTSISFLSFCEVSDINFMMRSCISSRACKHNSSVTARLHRDTAHTCPHGKIITSTHTHTHTHTTNDLARKHTALKRWHCE